MWYNDISVEWQNENEEIRGMSEMIPQIQFAFERMERCLATQFKILSFMTQTQHHVAKLYKNPEQFPLNRNSGFMTFEPSRVTLGPPDEVDRIENYINANLIQVQGKRVIATQGPLSATFYNFWRAVENYNVSNIFMLCSLIQKNKIKCDRYFPQKDQQGFNLQEKQYQIRLLEDDGKEAAEGPEVKKNPLRTRKILLKNTLTGSQRIITHYQLTDWQDGDKPSKSGIKRLNWVLNEFLNCLAEDKVPIVHCSAGIGRTGTFIAMAILRLQIQNNSDLSIFNQVRKLKQQRWGMVYTLSQYQYLYEFADKEIDRVRNGMDTLSSDSDPEQS